MLAYSSIEHMGLCVLLPAIARVALHTHVVAHSITKMMLSSWLNNILVGFITTRSEATALFTCMPCTGILWLPGLFAIAAPPRPVRD